MKQEKRHANKNYYGNPCWQCKDLLKGKKTQEEIDKEHNSCHGWYHCGNKCCGECDICGQ